MKILVPQAPWNISVYLFLLTIKIFWLFKAITVNGHSLAIHLCDAGMIRHQLIKLSRQQSTWTYRKSSFGFLWFSSLASLHYPLHRSRTHSSYFRFLNGIYCNMLRGAIYAKESKRWIWTVSQVRIFNEYMSETERTRGRPGCLFIWLTEEMSSSQR